MKYYNIFIDGIDKSGKDLIAYYVIHLSNFKYIVNGRGILSQLAYSKLYNRNDTYDLTQQENIVNVYLEVNKEDWLLRCKKTNEPAIDYEKNVEAFQYAINILNNASNIICFNTSQETPYTIAKHIVNYVDSLNKVK